MLCIKLPFLSMVEYIIKTLLSIKLVYGNNSCIRLMVMVHGGYKPIHNRSFGLNIKFIIFIKLIMEIML